MISIKGLSFELLQQLHDIVHCENNVFLANDLTANHIVIAGDEDGCNSVVNVVEKSGVTCTVLPVEGAFHTKYMSSVRAELVDAMKTIEFFRPKVPIICNIDAQPSSDISQLRSNLIEQIDHPVLFRQSLCFLHEKRVVPSEIYFCGPGRILQNIVNEAWNSFEITSLN